MSSSKTSPSSFSLNSRGRLEIPLIIRDLLDDQSPVYHSRVDFQRIANFVQWFEDHAAAAGLIFSSPPPCATDALPLLQNLISAHFNIRYALGHVNEQAESDALALPLLPLAPSLVDKLGLELRIMLSQLLSDNQEAQEILSPQLASLSICATIERMHTLLDLRPAPRESPG